MAWFCAHGTQHSWGTIGPCFKAAWSGPHGSICRTSRTRPAFSVSSHCPLGTERLAAASLAPDSYPIVALQGAVAPGQETSYCCFAKVCYVHFTYHHNHLSKGEKNESETRSVLKCAHFHSFQPSFGYW